MTSRFTHDQLQPMAQHDRRRLFGKLKQALDDLLEQESLKVNLHQVAEAIRALEGEDVSQLISLPSPHWVSLVEGFSSSSSEDALDVFKAMAASLKDHAILDYQYFIVDVLDRPEIRIKAIEAAPDIFTKQYTQETWKHLPVGTRQTNVFHILADMSIGATTFDSEATPEIISCLKKVGAADSPNPVTGDVVLHHAARRSSFDAFRVFVEHFRHELEATNKKGSTPLHKATLSSHPRKLQFLLDLGVNPRPVDDNQHTPLDYAIEVCKQKNAMALIDTGAYCLQDIERACDRNKFESDLLCAYHAACSARRILNVATDPAAPRPL